MSQENKDRADAAEARTQQTRGFMQQVRVAARRKYTPEEKIRIVLEGDRRNCFKHRDILVRKRANLSRYLLSYLKFDEAVSFP